MARCRSLVASAFSAAFLSLPDDLANIDADERRGRIGHVAELVEGRLRCPGVFLSVEEPEGMLDDVTVVAPRPVAASRADHAPQHRNTRLTDHGKCLIRPVRLDLYPSDDCTHWPVLPVVHSEHERLHVDHLHPVEPLARRGHEGHDDAPTDVGASVNSPISGSRSAGAATGSRHLIPSGAWNPVVMEVHGLDGE